ncbi:MAG TPA: hypothetical protein VFC25_13700 [Verrucomicrobiae bacterium]|nr:hypothetical protein [Verrucomicrobiae bacterium]
MLRPRMIAFAAVALFLMSPCASSTASTRGDRAAARGAVDYPYLGITVFSAAGKRIHRWEPEFVHEGASIRQVGYSSPHLHPGGGRLVSVKCDVRFSEQKPRTNPDSVACRLTELFVDGKDERALLDLSGAHGFSSPAYSPDGKTIVIVQDDGVVLYSVQDKKVVRTIAGVVMPPFARLSPSEARYFSLLTPDTHVQWAADGASVFVSGSRPRPVEELEEALPEGSEVNGVARVELETARVTWLNFYDERAGNHFEIQSGRWTEVHGTLPSRESIAAFFGSEPFPWPRGQLTTDGKFYLYVDPGSGLFWRDRLMRYDIAEDDLRCVKTLKRGLLKE